MALAAARAIADVVGEDKLNPSVIVPSVFDARVAPAVAAAVRAAAKGAADAGRPPRRRPGARRRPRGRAEPDAPPASRHGAPRSSRAGGDDHRRSGQHAGVLVDGDGQPAARHVHGDRAGRAARVPQRHRGHRARPDPHDRVSPTPRSCTRIRRAPARPPAATNSRSRPAGTPPGPAPGGRSGRGRPGSAPPTGQTRFGLPQSTAVPGKVPAPARPPRSSPYTRGTGMRTETASPVTRRPPRPARVQDRDPARLGQPGLHQIAGVHPHTVAAHLGQRAVGVPVVHEPLGLARCRRLGARRTHHPQHTVAADAAAPVAQRRDERRPSAAAAVGVGQDHEVVAGAVALGEAHAPSSVSDHRARIASPRTLVRRRAPVTARPPALPGQVRRAASSQRDPRVAAEPRPLPPHEPPRGPDRVARACASSHSPARNRSTCW